MSSKLVAIALALMLTGVGSAALGGPPQPTSESFLVDVELRNATGDILQGDSIPGSPTTYAGNEVNAWIVNRFEDDPDAVPPGDFFRFHPMKKRELRLSHPDIGEVTCVSGTWGPTGVHFLSHSTPQWFERMELLGSALGTARIVCQRDQKGQSLLVVRYPGTAEDMGAGECVQATRVSTDPLGIVFSPHSGCPATIVELKKERGEFTETDVLVPVTSAPFEITAVVRSK